MKNLVLLTVFKILILSSFQISALELKDWNQTNNCNITYTTNVFCTGNFNLTSFLLSINDTSDEPYSTYQLQIANTSISTLEYIGDVKWSLVLIENAPNLENISGPISAWKDKLTHFRAVGTKLPQNFADNFKSFPKILEVYIGPQTKCPTDSKLFYPCDCDEGMLSLHTPWGTGGSTWSSSGLPQVTTRVRCHNDSLTGVELKEIFARVFNSPQNPKIFDVLELRGEKIRQIPKEFLSGLQFTSIFIDKTPNLESIDSLAFHPLPSSESVQILDISGANFTQLSGNGTIEIFRAFSSLRNIRMLRCLQCGIPFIPPNAFSRGDGKPLENLRLVSLILDRRHQPKGIRSVGSYAFANCPNLRILGLSHNFIEQIDSYAFYQNNTGNVRQLEIELGMNPLKTLASFALSGGTRGLKIQWKIDSFAARDTANYPQFDITNKAVFQPFVEESVDNVLEIDYDNLDINCDCRSQWMFNLSTGMLKENVGNRIKVKRVVGNTINSEFSSVQCKAESSFDCLSSCLIFPNSNLIHCGGSGDNFNVVEEFGKISKLREKNNLTLSNLYFSTKRVKEFKKDSFSDFKFEEIIIQGAQDLQSIDDDAFSSSLNSLKKFSAQNTSIMNYPDFGIFPNLSFIQIDETFPFNFSTPIFKSTPKREAVEISLYNGTIGNSTFKNLNNSTVSLKIGKSKVRDCDTTSCLMSCEPLQMTLDSNVLQNFLEINKKHTISSLCFMECNCGLKWMHAKWDTYGSQIELWLDEYFGRSFYCAPPGVNLTSSDPNSFFPIDASKFKRGSTYFDESC